jgi:hypothetical protein
MHDSHHSDESHSNETINPEFACSAPDTGTNTTAPSQVRLHSFMSDFFFLNNLMMIKQQLLHLGWAVSLAGADPRIGIRCLFLGLHSHSNSWWKNG